MDALAAATSVVDSDLSAATALMGMASLKNGNDDPMPDSSEGDSPPSPPAADDYDSVLAPESVISNKRQRDQNGGAKTRRMMACRTSNASTMVDEKDAISAAMFRGEHLLSAGSSEDADMMYFELVIAQAKSKSDELCRDEKKPYENMYAARKALQDCKERLDKSASNSPARKLPRRLAARIQYRLGVNYYMTEEVHDGEKHLRKAAAILDDCWESVESHVPPMPADGNQDADLDPSDVSASSPDEWAELMDVYNHLGMIWSGREQGAKPALVFLRRSETIYKQRCEGRSQWQASKAVCGGDANRVLDSGKVDAEALWTLTLFYLAQVLGNQGEDSDPDTAAAHCQQTLRRQRKLGHSFDPMRWAKDVIGLSKFYMSKVQWVRSLQCARCAQACVSEHLDEHPGLKSDDEVQMLQADIAEASGQTFEAALHNAYARQQMREMGELPTKEKMDPAADSVLDFGDGARGGPLSNCAHLINVDSFESARRLYKWANSYYEKAKATYVLDGFVTRHVAILQSQSKLLKYLVAFETEPKRVAAMHQRRETLLRGLVIKTCETYLNPKVYEVQHKEITFELGEICQEVMDACIARGEAYAKKAGKTRTSDKERAKTAGLCASDSFAAFRALYGESKLNELDAHSKVPYLMSLFCEARIYGRLPSPVDSTEQLVAWQKKSLELFSRVVRIGKEILGDGSEAASSFSRELAMAAEMVELLPQKINRMHYEGKRL